MGWQMAGYGPAGMVRTPWGDASELRARRLPAGRGTPREEAARNQRERLFAALVATVAEKGYEATRVADLVELSGVSRSAFYAHFSDKQACFLAAVDALLGSTIEVVAGGAGADLPEGEARGRWAFEAFVELIVQQPAAARMCFVELFAAGPEAVEAVSRAMDAFEAFVGGELEKIPGHGGMPPQIVRGAIGGMRKVIHARLYRGAEAELSELAGPLFDWAVSYLPPPAPLRAPRLRPVPEAALSGHGPAERVLNALTATVVGKGYPETTVADVVERAATSQRTFYEHFANKEEATLAALDAGAARMVAAVLPAYRRAPDWPSAVRGGLEAMLAFGAAEPEYTQLGVVEIYAVGRRALEQRDVVLQGLEALLAPGYEQSPETPEVAAEAIGGAIYALIYDQVRAGGPQSLPQLAPLATYMALAPFLGAEEACAVANGEGRRRTPETTP